MMLHNITPPVLILLLLACEITGKQGKESSKCSCRGVQWPKLQAEVFLIWRGIFVWKGRYWTKDYFMHWKLTIMGDHCWWSDTTRGFYIVLVHPCLSQRHHTGDAFSCPSRWRWSTTQRQHSASIYRSRQTPSAGRMWLARLCLTDENRCHLDEVWAMDEAWAAPVGTQHPRV